MLYNYLWAAGMEWGGGGGGGGGWGGWWGEVRGEGGGARERVKWDGVRP